MAVSWAFLGVRRDVPSPVLAVLCNRDETVVGHVKKCRERMSFLPEVTSFWPVTRGPRSGSLVSWVLPRVAGGPEEPPGG